MLAERGLERPSAKLGLVAVAGHVSANYTPNDSPECRCNDTPAATADAISNDTARYGTDSLAHHMVRVVALVGGWLLVVARFWRLVDVLLCLVVGRAITINNAFTIKHWRRFINDRCCLIDYRCLLIYHPLNPMTMAVIAVIVVIPIVICKCTGTEDRSGNYCGNPKLVHDFLLIEKYLLHRVTLSFGIWCTSRK